jgi:hypothetical protein
MLLDNILRKRQFRKKSGGKTKRKIKRIEEEKEKKICNRQEIRKYKMHIQYIKRE